MVHIFKLELLFIQVQTPPLVLPVKVGDVVLLRSEVFGPQRFFGWPLEVVVADRVLFEVCRSVHSLSLVLPSKYLREFVPNFSGVLRGFLGTGECNVEHRLILICLLGWPFLQLTCGIHHLVVWLFSCFSSALLPSEVFGSFRDFPFIYD